MYGQNNKRLRYRKNAIMKLFGTAPTEVLHVRYLIFSAHHQVKFDAVVIGWLWYFAQGEENLTKWKKLHEGNINDLLEPPMWPKQLRRKWSKKLPSRQLVDRLLWINGVVNVVVQMLLRVRDGPRDNHSSHSFRSCQDDNDTKNEGQSDTTQPDLQNNAS